MLVLPPIYCCFKCICNKRRQVQLDDAVLAENHLLKDKHLYWINKISYFVLKSSHSGAFYDSHIKEWTALRKDQFAGRLSNHTTHKIAADVYDDAAPHSNHKTALGVDEDAAP